MPSPPPRDAGPNDLPARLLLYDGHCALCNGAVRALLRIDRRGRIAFAPLHGSAARAILARHPALRGVDSLLYVRDAGRAAERVLVRSEAAIAAGEDAGGWTRGVAALARLVPRALRDAIYDRVARVRYQAFGRHDECPLPPASARDRFLPLD